MNKKKKNENKANTKPGRLTSKYVRQKRKPNLRFRRTFERRFYCKKCEVNSKNVLIFTRVGLSKHFTQFHHFPKVKNMNGNEHCYRCQECGLILKSGIKNYEQHRDECDLHSPIVGEITDRDAKLKLENALKFYNEPTKKGRAKKIYLSDIKGVVLNGQKSATKNGSQNVTKKRVKRSDTRRPSTNARQMTTANEYVSQVDLYHQIKYNRTAGTPNSEQNVFSTPKPALNYHSYNISTPEKCVFNDKSDAEDENSCIKCSICEEVVADSAKFAIHSLKHVRDDIANISKSNGFNCDLCGEGLREIKVIQHHFIEHLQFFNAELRFREKSTLKRDNPNKTARISPGRRRLSETP